MRSLLAAAVSLGALAVLCAPGAGATSPRLTLRPNPVSFGEELVVRGRNWPRIEFCRRKVRLSLRSDQNALPIGKAPVSRRGRFTFRYPVSASNVGRGRWTLRAKLPCESGDDGSPNPVVRSRALTIR